MKAPVVCLLFAFLLMFVFTKGNELYKRNNARKEEQQRRKNFNKYDTNRDGFIDIHELRIKGTKDGIGEQIDFIFENADEDGNEKISYEEFKISPLGIVR